MTRELPEQLTYGVYVSALPCINLDNHNRIRTTDVRLLRRITRDAKFRGTSPEHTIDMARKYQLFIIMPERENTPFFLCSGLKRCECRMARPHGKKSICD